MQVYWFVQWGQYVRPSIVDVRAIYSNFGFPSFDFAPSRFEAGTSGIVDIIIFRIIKTRVRIRTDEHT